MNSSGVKTPVVRNEDVDKTGVKYSRTPWSLLNKLITIFSFWIFRLGFYFRILGVRDRTTEEEHIKE